MKRSWIKITVGFPAKDRVSLTVLAAILTIAWMTPAVAQQSVFNGSFGTDLRGWTLANTPIAWSGLDAGGLADSGSVLIVNIGSRMNGRGVSACLHDVTFTEGAQYRIAAQIHLPEGQTSTGWAAVGLNWYSEPHCQEHLPISGPRAELDHANSGFEEVATEFTVPQGARSAIFVGYVTKEQDDGALLAYLDDFTIVPVGSSPTGTSIFVPGSAHVTGFGGAMWRTDLEVNNPMPAQTSFTLELLERDQANPQPQSATYSVGPGQSVRFEDVIQSVFGFDGAAALRITPANPTLVVTSRTFNQSTGGTFGQFLPGIPRDRAIVYGRQARLVQLTHHRSASSGYRTNIGLVNATNMAIQVDVGLSAADGTQLGTVTVDLPAAGFIQLDKVFEQVTDGDVSDGYVLLSTPTPGGAFLAYASVIDNVTGDAVCVQTAGL